MMTSQKSLLVLQAENVPLKVVRYIVLIPINQQRVIIHTKHVMKIQHTRAIAAVQVKNQTLLA